MVVVPVFFVVNDLSTAWISIRYELVVSLSNFVISRTIPSVYSLEISVSDQGSNPLHTTAQVYVSIIGEPEFGNLPDNIEVNENEHVGFVIFTVQSKTPLNSKQFYIKSGNAERIPDISRYYGIYQVLVNPNICITG
jgi:hypothetical protein